MPHTLTRRYVSRGNMKLYKYLSSNKNTLDALVNTYCWFSKPDDFNDPFDCALIKNESLNHTLRNKRKVFCLAEDKDNLLMWSHYASSHTGFVIEYSPFSDSDIDLLIKNHLFPNAPKEKLAIIQNAKPVQYKTVEELNAYMSFFPTSDDELVAQYQSFRENGDEEEYLERFNQGLYLKHEAWSYEKEHRLIHEGNHRHCQPGQITSVYFGAKMSSQDKRTIAVLMAERFKGKCKIYQAFFSKERYEINFREFNPKLDLDGLGLTFET